MKRRPKQKVYKHLAFYADIFERAEAEADAENKSLNEWMNDAAHEKAERKSQKQPQPQSQQPQSQQPHSQSEPLDDTAHHSNLTPDEAERIIRDQIIPSINDAITDDKYAFVILRRSTKILLETIEIKQGSRKKVELKQITHLNPLERARDEGIKAAKERREINERLELMSGLPQPIEETDKGGTNLEGSDASFVSDTLKTSSTITTNLTEAEFLVLKRQQEARDKRLKELAEEMRAKVKNNVKLVDESKEIPIEDDRDIPIPPTDGSEGVLEDDTDKIPQDDS
jgi:hypothetical protein